MAAASRRRRLKRSDRSEPGLHRRRRGRGFSYETEAGEPVRDSEVLERIRALAVPPAWSEVWICPDPMGHLQATGIDAAGRKQYLYHSLWRERRDQEKFERMARFGARLPQLRRAMAAALHSEPLTHEWVLACAVRLLDVALFRIGSEQYADDDGGIGLATIRTEHVSVQDGTAAFDFPAKGGVRRAQVIHDPVCVAAVTALGRRRGGRGRPELLAYRERRRWYPLRSEEINEYLKARLSSDEFSAKDFRTWNATVLAAVSLATDGRGVGSKTGRRRAIQRAVKAVAELLGNTPAVARRSYIDPQVFDRYLSGWTIAAELERLPSLDPANDRIRGRIERAVLDLLAERSSSGALEHE